MSKFYQTSKEKLMSLFLKLIPKIREEGTLPNSFYEVNITLMPKPGKDTTRQE